MHICGAIGYSLENAAAIWQYVLFGFEPLRQ